MKTGKDTTGKKWGVLLVNMGGPSGLDEVKDYLLRIFSDRHILPMPALPRKAIAKAIARFRTSEASRRYALTGNRSPLIENTQNQQTALEKELSFPVAAGMRYSRPFMEEGIHSLVERGVNSLILLPLYPQFSLTTTQSVISYFNHQINWSGPVHIIGSYYQNPGFIHAHKDKLLQQLQKMKSLDQTAVVFVAHSIPVSRIKKGDPYVRQVENTVSSIKNFLPPNLITCIAYQSRVGPVKWQGPDITEVLDELSSKGIRFIVAHPVSFSSENLETLYDLDIEFKQKCLEQGIKLIRIPTPGVSPAYIQALSAIVKEGIQKWELQNA